MKIYLDLIFFMNFFYDLLLLICVDNILKRKRKLIYHLISSFIGSLSIITLFLKVSNTILLIIKVIVSIIMCLISFSFISFKHFINNILYLYMCSIILAGFLMFINNTFSYDHIGLVFINNGYSINYFILLFISPIILFFYYKSNKNLKKTYNLYYSIDIYFNDLKINCLAYLDSGNNLIDPTSKKGIIIVNNKLLTDIHNIRDPIYVPYSTVSGKALMKCYKPSFIMINNKKVYNYLIGEVDYQFKDGIKALLNSKLMEDNYV